MRIGISGSGGFLGSRLVQDLTLRGDTVVPVVRRAVQVGGPVTTIYAGSGVSDAALLRQFIATSLDVLVLAGAAYAPGCGPADVSLLVNGNVLLPARLMAAAHQAGVGHVIIVGSSWQEVEGSGYNPMDFYAATKQALSDLGIHFRNAGMRVSDVRLFDTYGPGDSRAKLIPMMLESARRHRILDLSPGQQLIHLVHIADVSRGIMAVCDSPGADATATVALDSLRCVSVQELAELLQSLVPEFRYNLGAIPYRPREIMRPRSQYARPTGWQPTIELREGLIECIEASRRRGGC